MIVGTPPSEPGTPTGGSIPGTPTGPLTPGTPGQLRHPWPGATEGASSEPGTPTFPQQPPHSAGNVVFFCLCSNICQLGFQIRTCFFSLHNLSTVQVTWYSLVYVRIVDLLNLLKAS